VRGPQGAGGAGGGALRGMPAGTCRWHLALLRGQGKAGVAETGAGSRGGGGQRGRGEGEGEGEGRGEAFPAGESWG